jgi:carboxymethylenebutenolidase
MGEMIQLNTKAHSNIGAYLSRPAGVPKGGLVIVQEIFGVNAHMRSVVDRFAALGYTTIAPAFFDHVETGVELEYDPASFVRARELVAATPFDRVVDDIQSAAQYIHSAGPVGVVGYCWGGTAALLAATRLGLPSVSYYGSRNVNFLDEKLKAPVQFHFGAEDGSTPPEAIQRHRDELHFVKHSGLDEKHDVEIYTYPAHHGFNRDVTPDVYDPASAKLALDRALSFFERHLHTQ